MPNENIIKETFETEIKLMIQEFQDRSKRLAIVIANSNPNDTNMKLLKPLFTLCEAQTHHLKMILFNQSMNEVKEILNQK